MLDKLTEKQKQEKLNEIIDTWDNLHRAVQFLAWFGKILGWCAVVGGALSGVWLSHKTKGN